MLKIYNRMPVILHPQEYELWRDRNLTESEKPKHIHPQPHQVGGDVDGQTWTVSTKSIRNNAPQIMN